MLAAALAYREAKGKMDEFIWALFDGLREVADTAMDVADPKGIGAFF